MGDAENLPPVASKSSWPRDVGGRDCGRGDGSWITVDLMADTWVCWGEGTGDGYRSSGVSDLCSSDIGVGGYDT